MNSFKINSLIPEKDKPTYDHGFTTNEVEYIKKTKQEIERRDLIEFPVTLKEFQEIIIPWNRIHRTEAFNLNVKDKKATTKRKTAVSKPKQTKKAIEKKLNDIVFKQAAGKTLTEEETTFFNEHIVKLGEL